MKTFFLLLSFTLIFTNHSFAAASTKNKLHQLENHMLTIKKQLSIDETEREKQYQALSLTEKKISQDLQSLHRLTTEEKVLQKNIQTITTRINTLNQERQTQEKRLARHIRARQKLGAIHPWQWLFEQENTRALSRLFVFYDYLFQADQKLIQELRDTSNQLKNQQSKLAVEQTHLKTLQKQLNQRHARLKTMKAKQENLLNTLTQTIQTKHERLQAMHQDKTRLQALLKRLSARPQKTNTLAHLSLDGAHLESPLSLKALETKRLNQGLVFLAGEGTPVHAILPGKVIFSDWLKGYGLLIIIDHGDDVMSLYAHNASIFKPLGSPVKQGEQIATVGHTGGLRENGLYFELRRRGRAVPPREWMS